MAASPTLNERAQRLADHMASTAGALRIGVQPTTGWLDASGLAIADGVVCDSRCVAAPGIVAAGDVARWDHPRFGSLRVEHWTNAVSQAQQAVQLRWWSPTNGAVSHINPTNNSTPAMRIKAAGYCPAGIATTGENTFTSSGVWAYPATPRGAVNWWLSDPPHRATMLSPAFRGEETHLPSFFRRAYLSPMVPPTVYSSAALGKRIRLAGGAEPAAITRLSVVS